MNKQLEKMRGQQNSVASTCETIPILGFATPLVHQL